MKKETSSESTFRFASSLEKSHNKLWGCHFEVPVSVAKKLIEGNDRRVLCSVNGLPGHQCALIPHGNGSFVITVNKKLRDTLRLDFGMKVQVSLKKDRSEYGLPLPEELEELFHQDPEGKKIFHALTRGKQRTLLYIVGKAKTPEKRVTHAIIVVNHLKANHGKINYRQLGVALKDPRTRKTPLR